MLNFGGVLHGDFINQNHLLKCPAGFVIDSRLLSSKLVYFTGSYWTKSTYLGIIIHLLGTMDIPVPLVKKKTRFMNEKNLGERT